ncbi:putative histone acetyltransferase type b catalytic subunit [Aspergillus campestris IBT 28561]|uniref:Histone acetyltransferase type B catalytic subunit n=1 Tax=Aspergillus campestris (strain IBT 28561) TaxID=1392248 RepID=A0A2I1CUU0_ASPC2|nr:putative histone acetyltransferase type b catalytic subunit [Aspergillus campestris IBT 28561]PKY01393.1 putative histone acetyltransferase type b catalytic subunit [Aspergillus campestris IBT 28561]
MASEGDWSCDANDSVHITVVQPGKEKPTTLSTFHPQFTYPIFGDEEQIFGYRGLIIRLRFAAHDLRPQVHISYDEKFKPVGDAVPVDLLKALRPFVPEEAFTALPEYEKALQEDKDAKDFVPPGKLVHSYVTRGRSYEIWAGSLANPEVRRLLDRAQVLVSLFIEAGTPLETDDPEWTLKRWMVYFVYEKVTPPTPSASQYSIVGYATTYRWWLYRRDATTDTLDGSKPYPPAELDLANLPSRLRISQFLILPPHQGSGHGTHLYTTIHDACVADTTIVELTVEDPNEAFDALRDTADYHILHPVFVKHNVNINPDPYDEQTKKRRPRRVPTSALIPTAALQDIRAAFKIQSTQFSHILEMFLLAQIPPKNRHTGGANMARLLIRKYNAEDPNERRYYWWRMLTKQRLYKRSRDMLIQMDVSERVQALEDTVTNVEEGYAALLKVFEAREEALKAKEAEAGGLQTTTAAEGSSSGRDKRNKRKLTVEDDEDDEEEEEDPAMAKRPKV